MPNSALRETIQGISSLYSDSEMQEETVILLHAATYIYMYKYRNQSNHRVDCNNDKIDTVTEHLL